MTPTLCVAYGRVIQAVMQPGVYRATKYLSPTQVIKATRRRYKGKLLTGRISREEILLTLGKPNYAERRFITRCRKAGEPFPVKKIQLHTLVCSDS